MPWTVAHAAAVLPLRRLSASRLNFAALVIGSFTPDVGYYVRAFRLARFAHTFPAGLLACVPIGLCLLVAFYTLRKPVCHLLPEPHRGALTALTTTPFPVRPIAILWAVASIAIGAWTHVVWDSFTHRTGWVVERFAVLTDPAIAVGSTDLAVYGVLQHLSTIVGVTALLVAYVAWLRRAGDRTPRSAGEELWRYGVLLGLTVVALAIAGALASHAVAAMPPRLVARAFVFRIAVYGVALFVPLLIVAAVVCWVGRRAPVVSAGRAT
jgi:hypothetical protein